jgi:hypothetical protein
LPPDEAAIPAAPPNSNITPPVELAIPPLPRPDDPPPPPDAAPPVPTPPVPIMLGASAVPLEQAPTSVRVSAQKRA